MSIMHVHGRHFFLILPPGQATHVSRKTTTTETTWTTRRHKNRHSPDKALAMRRTHGCARSKQTLHNFTTNTTTPMTARQWRPPLPPPGISEASEVYKRWRRKTEAVNVIA